MTPGLYLEFAPLNPYHPTSLEMFTDFGSVLHVAVGFLVGLFPGWDVAALGAYTAYQLGQVPSGVSLCRTAGEIIEFVIGLILAKFFGAAVVEAVNG